MKTYSIKSTYYFLILVLLALISCDSGEEEIASLSQENSELKNNYQNQLIETRTATRTADSLQTIVNHLQNEVQKMKGDMPVYKASSEDDKAIEDLVNNLHRGWTDMVKNHNTNELLQYFLPKYTTSSVRINTENIPSVQRSNDANFEDHLNALMLANDLGLSFGQTKFLYTEVKGDIFVTSFRTRIRVYQNNKQTHTSSLITQLSGEKTEDGWKVGSYNWITFNYL